jgi:hypothetical protein
MPQARLAEKAAVPSDECWYTVLTNSRHITAEGSVHSQALKGKRISAAIQRTWAHEMSGRLVSLSGDIAAIEADARQRVSDAQLRYSASNNGKIASNIMFIGVACARAGGLRGIIKNQITSDVIYTPQQPHDMGHSDVAFFNSTEADLEDIRDWLLPRLRGIRPQRLHLLVGSCGDDQLSTANA